MKEKDKIKEVIVTITNCIDANIRPEDALKYTQAILNCVHSVRNLEEMIVK